MSWTLLTHSQSRWCPVWVERVYTACFHCGMEGKNSNCIHFHFLGDLSHNCHRKLGYKDRNTKLCSSFNLPSLRKKKNTCWITGYSLAQGTVGVGTLPGIVGLWVRGEEWGCISWQLYLSNCLLIYPALEKRKWKAVGIIGKPCFS